ncbi:MAG: hypothetical protein FWB96_06755 [Defluviitaleaceae bacterium]|nr:hypothetical protein [Defluviitaleaceae bacterium]MCL2262606.1 hypothetical protein [Defluviitaleaceae bacterium]
MHKQNLISELTEKQLDELLSYTPSFSEKNLENIKRLSLEKVKERPPRRISMKKFITIVAAATFFIIASTAIFAGGGGLEQFLARFDSNFGELAIPPLYPAYAESQGIRIEAVGAQQIGNIVLVYLSMQDVSGENRLTRYMRPDIEIYVDGKIMNGARTSRRLEFNEFTNTGYFEARLAGEIGMPWAENIELVTTLIECFDPNFHAERGGQVWTAFEGEWAFTVNSSDLGITPITWVDVPAGDMHINYMSLTPFGVQVYAAHNFDFDCLHDFPRIDIRIEFENRLFNKRLNHGGGGSHYDWFSSVRWTKAPIDIDKVTAVIINGERILVP